MRGWLHILFAVALFAGALFALAFGVGWAMRDPATAALFALAFVGVVSAFTLFLFLGLVQIGVIREMLADERRRKR